LLNSVPDEELTREVEEAKKITEMFDEEVVREIADSERIKRIEFKTQFGALADAHVDFYGKTIENWEKYVKEVSCFPLYVRVSNRSGLLGLGQPLGSMCVSRRR